ncbi:hypothetical protein [Adhaeribacter aquaticus]|uniref:hypothetical protein n=1 Tax=Adhaeribacter aquaticus TaxID=299567 RepID=UPI000413A232|nr:hypothetical protein [Adhaeribacter aquaticus]
MQKRIIDQVVSNKDQVQLSWLNLEQKALVEITSEDEAFPIENSFSDTEGAGWKAGKSGKQTIRIIFDEPQDIKLIRLKFCEKDQTRTQEFQLRWLPANNQAYREIVRQQFNFNQPDSITESEDYSVGLQNLKALELQINPDITNKESFATLAKFQIS